MVTETGVRARTRRAILDAAVQTLTRQPNASLGDIAVAANVGRTTVHRYFPERADLMAGILADAEEKIHDSTVRARVDEGTAPAALARLCAEYFEHGDVFMLMFTNPALMGEMNWEEESEDDLVLRRLVERGHEEGTIDRDLPAEWLQQLLWALLYTAWEAAGGMSLPNQKPLSRHEALRLCLRTLEKAIS